MPDRVIFKGHFGFRHPGNLAVFLTRSGVLLKDFGRSAEKQSDRVKAPAHATLTQQAIAHLDTLSTTRTVNNKRIARFNPVALNDATLFAAVLLGNYSLNGFRNRDLTVSLHLKPARNHPEARRRCERTPRLIAKLHGRGLAAKVPRSRLYRVTTLGQQLMSAAVRIRRIDFARALQDAA